VSVEAESTVRINHRGRAWDPGQPKNIRVYAMWCHLGPLIAAVSVIASSGVTFIIPPLVALALWQIKNTESEYIDDHGRESLNFQISLILLSLLLIPITIFTCGVGAVIYIGMPVLAIAGGIMGAIAAHRGEYFRYPMTWRPVKSSWEREAAQAG